ncbi:MULTISPECIES: DUF2062 domain-containing protein [Gimesia]|uniref:DUF2062 domain-containing protein n=1 Tax=Gimesia benthica TaxID=2608982 RepID=A0A6I6AFU4_9PLAN|nr:MULTISPECIES: DUF2062 domain-containing protein [Gimesia]KAA0142498.1 DUF2062 domain-containing protein [Gimesia chilikensis]QGQ24916.1 DUF2062 domain-containing protein [Gimesia benthica]
MSSAKPAWTLNPRVLLRSILMLDDSAHSIALGTAIGMFIALTPTVGIQMLMVVCVAFLTRPLFRFNQVASLITVYISNPLTIVPIYWFDYKVGTLFVGGSLTQKDFARILEFEGFSGWWETVKQLLLEVGSPLIIGSLVVGTFFGLITYPIMLRLLKHLRRSKSTDGPEDAAEQSVRPAQPIDSEQSMKSVHLHSS